MENLTAWLEAGLPAWAAAAIEELVAQEAWGELNDRFYRYLEFGTGGMRGRTIGVVAARSETGQPGPMGTPEHPAVGSNVMNDFTVVRATIGLYRYVHGYLARAGALRCAEARHRPRRAAFLAALLRTGGLDVVAARRRGLHFRWRRARRRSSAFPCAG